ncbi:hypothetical protein [Nocardioides sp.]|nr:hypothetical protein [Nocardioides sp.]MDP3891837.1 hypothetical protein [Nocardioides sp.]
MTPGLAGVAPCWSPLGSRVVYAAQLWPGRCATVEEWVPAELLTTE